MPFVIIMWKNIVQRGRRMRIECGITKATNTHSEYVILFFFTATVVARMRLSVNVIHTLPVLFGTTVYSFVVYSGLRHAARKPPFLV
jgi:hypothetical protein